MNNNKNVSVTKFYTSEVKEYAKRQEEWLNFNDPKQFLTQLQPTKPLYYFNRLISRKYPDSEFSKTIGEKFGYEGCNDEEIKNIRSKRNNFIKEQVEKAGININDKLEGLNTSNLQSLLCNSGQNSYIEKKSSLNRDEIFLISLILDLNLDEMKSFLIHCSCKQNINFKSPKEVILTYCFSISDIDREKENIVQTYLKLYKDYLKTNRNIVCDNNQETQFFENNFDEITGEENLKIFLEQLPNTDSTSAINRFKDEYNSLITYLKDSLNEYREDDVNSYDDTWLDELIKTINNKETHQSIENSDIYKKIFSVNNITKKNIFDGANYIIDEMPKFDRFLKIVNGNTNYVSKNELLLICFLNFTILGDRDNCIEESIDENKKECTYQSIVNSFIDYTNSILNDARYSSVYLPNSFERFLVYCLLTEKPLETLKIFIN